MDENVSDIKEIKISKKTKELVPIEYRYRLCMYTSTGILRPDIAKGAFVDIHRRCGELLRAIPSDRFVTIDEIQSNYALIMTRLRLSVSYTNDDIQNIIKDVVDAGMIEVRS